MWHPVDEQRLLAGLYRSIGKVGGEFAFCVDWLAKLLNGARTVPEYGEEPDEPREDMGPSNEPNIAGLKAGIARVCRDRKRVESALSLLAARSLITLDHHSTEASVVIVGLNLAGHDLGRQYASRSSWLNLWLRENKHTWFWLSVVAVTNVLNPLIVHFLEKRLRP
jgi:hypothetical protein